MADAHPEARPRKPAPIRPDWISKTLAGLLLGPGLAISASGLLAALLHGMPLLVMMDGFSMRKALSVCVVWPACSFTPTSPCLVCMGARVSPVLAKPAPTVRPGSRPSV